MQTVVYIRDSTGRAARWPGTFEHVAINAQPCSISHRLDCVITSTHRYIERGTESSVGTRAFISFVPLNPLTSDDRAAASESAAETAKQSEFANRLELHREVAAFFYNVVSHCCK